MSIDTTTPRTRRALIAGAIGGMLASVAAFAKAPVTRAGVDGDVVLDDTNTGAGTTEILATGSNPAFRVAGGGVGLAAVSADGHAIRATSTTSVGVRGASGVSDTDTLPDPITPSTGVYGISVAGTGVYGASDTGVGVQAASNASTVAAIVATSSAGEAIHARGQLDGVIGESAGDQTGVVGFSGAGSAPAGPSRTGVYGEATQDAASRGVIGKSILGQGVRGEATTGQGVAGIATGGQGVRGDATSGQGVRGAATSGQGVRGDATTGVGVQATATSTGIALTTASVSGLAVWAQSSQGHAIKGRALLDGVIGEAAGDRSGVVGFSGPGTAPAGPAKTGVYGEATQDVAARGVVGHSTAGQGVRGEATTGVGVQAIATTGVALNVTGRALFSRSGRVTIPAGVTYIDVPVPGGMTATAIAFATLQYLRTGVFIMGARPNHPAAGTLRIYLNKAAAYSTPAAWFVVG